MLVLLNLCCAMMGDKMRWKRVREREREGEIGRMSTRRKRKKRRSSHPAVTQGGGGR